ncbi:Serine protease SPPA, chloroplastic [Capsicum chinense]|nr:Serine protease SPPA, chloroplastic [Capsicum chinense]
MWREIRLLAESKPVIASMADVAASGGYYMAMAAQAIVAESLTLTGSIGVVTEHPLLHTCGVLSFRSCYSALAKIISAQVDKIEEVAQGRVWTGKDALSRGLVDAVGGLSRAVAIAKQKANIPQDLNLLIFKERASEFSCQNQVSVVELSRSSASLPEVLSGIGSSLARADRTLKELLNDVPSSNGIQARMDGVMFEKLGGAAYSNPLFLLIKDCFGSF